MYTVFMGKYWKLLVVIIVLLVVFLISAYLVLLKNKEGAINTTFASEVPGYQIEWVKDSTLNEFLNEIDFYNVEHLDKARQNSSYVNKITVTLTDKKVPLYPVYYDAGFEPQELTLSYSTDYSINNGELTVYIYVNPELLSNTSPEVINRVNDAINAQVLRTLVMSLKSLPNQQQPYSSMQSMSDDYVKRFVLDKELNELAFKLVTK